MKNKTLLVAKKEWDRFFGDPRMVISSLIFPGIFLYIIYAFVAPIMMDLVIGVNKKGTVFAVNPPPVIQLIFDHAGINLSLIQDSEKEIILEGIEQKDGNFLVVFPSYFEEKVSAYDVRSGETAPEIFLYYNSSSDSFIELYSKINTSLILYEKSVAKKFDINRSGGGDMAHDGKGKRHFLSAILPMFLIVFIFHGAMAASTAAITGEKEQGILATLLITPITAIELAVGKVFAISIDSFLCGISGALGILLSLPKFIESLNSKLNDTQGLSAITILGAINISQYTIVDLVVLTLVLLSGSCLIVTFIAIVSIYARTAKEAQMLLSPMIIIFMLISLFSAFNNSSGIKEFSYYAIPVYNSLQCLNDIFDKSYIFKHIALTIGSNLFLSAVGSFALSRLFKNEKIMAAG